MDSRVKYFYELQKCLASLVALFLALAHPSVTHAGDSITSREKLLNAHEELPLPSGRNIVFDGTYKASWIFRIDVEGTNGSLNEIESVVAIDFLIRQIELNVSLEKGRSVSIIEIDSRLDPNLDEWLIKRIRTFFQDRNRLLEDVKEEERIMANFINPEFVESQSAKRIAKILEAATGQRLTSIRLARESWMFQQGGKVGTKLDLYHQDARAGFSSGPLVQYIFAE